ncbi:hypothetical protein M211_2659 [Acinetobacter lactucae]|nr:hypothetical protein M211_2659 [Acinetobacter lactucae]
MITQNKIFKYPLSLTNLDFKKMEKMYCYVGFLLNAKTENPKWLSLYITKE